MFLVTTRCGAPKVELTNQLLGVNSRKGGFFIYANPYKRIYLNNFMI